MDGYTYIGDRVWKKTFNFRDTFCKDVVALINSTCARYCDTNKIYLRIEGNGAYQQRQRFSQIDLVTTDMFTIVHLRVDRVQYNYNDVNINNFQRKNSRCGHPRFHLTLTNRKYCGYTVCKQHNIQPYDDGHHQPYRSMDHGINLMSISYRSWYSCTPSVIIIKRFVVVGLSLCCYFVSSILDQKCLVTTLSTWCSQRGLAHVVSNYSTYRLFWKMSCCCRHWPLSVSKLSHKRR